MKYSDELKNYLKILNCSAQDLSNKSGLSPNLISRYLNDKRNPRKESEYFFKVVNGIYEISVSKNIELDINEIYNVLKKSLSYDTINYDDFINNFNLLLMELNINTRTLSKAIGYDTSFISRVKNKSRKPYDINDFSLKVAQYIAENYQNEDKKKLVISTIKCSSTNLNITDKYKNVVHKWLITHHEEHSELIKGFLSRLDNFNLNDYINTDFKKIKIPTSPIIFKNSKIFYGTDGRKKSEAEFLKTTLLSKSNEPIFFYNNLPITDASQDENFKNKWILAVTMVLKKGLHLNMIHCIDRPINEMILGLENWIPIYMTGSISPYYFKEPPSNMFNESLYVSGSVCLSGTCLKNSYEQSRFYLTTKSDELNFYKEKSKYMLSKAKPLMTIYKKEDKSKFEEFIKNENTLNIKKIENSSFKNIDFYICKNKWISINKKNEPKMHFIIYNSKLRNAIESFLAQEKVYPLK